MQTPLFGVGFRTQHAGEIARAPGAVDWFEVLSDHYIGVGGTRRALLERLRAARPVALHGVSLSIAGTEPLDREYLDGLAALAAWLEPVFVSDHLCWTALGGHESHDLLPVARTREVLEHVAARVAHVQESLGRRLLLENASAYVAFRAREMEEEDFLAELCRRTGCGVLLDVNNLVVNAANLGGDPKRALELLPVDAVGYLHLAGHAVLEDVRIDTHDEAVPAAVWTLFESAVQSFPQAGVILERDDNLPAYAQLLVEVEQARARHRAALSGSCEPHSKPGSSGRAASGASRVFCEPHSKPGSSGRAASGASRVFCEPHSKPGSSGRAASGASRVFCEPHSKPGSSGRAASGASRVFCEPHSKPGSPGRAASGASRVFCEPHSKPGSPGRAASGASRVFCEPHSKPGSPGRAASGASVGTSWSWQDVQRDFFSRIVGQPLGREQSDLGELLDESLPVRAARGLRVYSDAYTASLREALATNFAALAHVLSPADFDRLAVAYLRAHPPRGFDFLRLGAHFAEFVAGFDFAADYGVPRAVLAELAVLEQTQLEVQDAPDPKQAVTPAALAALAPEDWEQARFAFAAAYRVVRAAHDVALVVEAVAAGEAPARPATGDVAYLVSRAGDGVRTERLAAREAAVLEALLAGESLREACGDDEAAAEAGARRLVAAAAAGLLTRAE